MALGDTVTDPNSGQEFEVVWDGSAESPELIWRDPQRAYTRRPMIEHAPEARPVSNGEYRRRKTLQSTLDKARAELERLLP